MNIIEQFKLTDKKALVTGGGSGIGRAYVQALAEAGADVAVVDMKTDAAESVADEVMKLGRASLAIHADVTQPDEIDRMIDTVVAEWGRLDIAVNNAGVSTRGPAEDLPLEDWDRVVNLNLRGSFLCAQKEARVMIPQQYGKIIFTTSISALVINGPQLHIAYGASKAGLEHLVKGLGVEWIQYGINVNGICPGAVYTPFVMQAEDLKDLIPVWEALYPIKRLCHVEELKGAVVYLASDVSSFMVGHSMIIDGGYTLL
ncbi:SDR family oxidoreductase [candidate division KSB3 bacterium]|uniref:SDR family oxidoreductase n=1 Tax=candidate division KSB3 bacterium TaxID=2044937 RepID=A0A9D5JX66_9BACT|nr:SDR family oxidoreductase [candidate division KSB3 bacterium]MBD3325883.1 SDR family oxidoreductase [candidate division KSB3 bacterium]